MKAQKVSMRFDNIVRRSVNEYQIMLPYNYFATPNENDFRAFQGVAVESKVCILPFTVSLLLSPIVALFDEIDISTDNP